MSEKSSKSKKGAKKSKSPAPAKKQDSPKAPKAPDANVATAATEEAKLVNWETIEQTSKDSKLANSATGEDDIRSEETAVELQEFDTSTRDAQTTKQKGTTATETSVTASLSEPMGTGQPTGDNKPQDATADASESSTKAVRLSLEDQPPTTPPASSTKLKKTKSRPKAARTSDQVRVEPRADRFGKANAIVLGLLTGLKFTLLALVLTGVINALTNATFKNKLNLVDVSTKTEVSEQSCTFAAIWTGLGLLHCAFAIGTCISRRRFPLLIVGGVAVFLFLSQLAMVSPFAYVALVACPQPFVDHERNEPLAYYWTDAANSSAIADVHQLLDCCGYEGWEHLREQIGYVPHSCCVNASQSCTNGTNVHTKPCAPVINNFVCGFSIAMSLLLLFLSMLEVAIIVAIAFV